MAAIAFKEGTKEIPKEEIPKEKTKTQLVDGEVVLGDDAAEAVTRVISSGLTYLSFRQVFANAYRQLNQPIDRPEQVKTEIPQSAGNQLSAAFIKEYFKATGKFPTDTKILDFVNTSLDIDYAKSFIQGETNAVKTGDEQAFPYIQAKFQKEIKEIETPEQITGKVKEDKRIEDLLKIVGQQRGESGELYKQALEAFKTPLPTFTPEFSQEVLQEIASRISSQGETARAEVESEQAKRGLTGSSIEAFALSEQEANTVDSLRQATFDFLLKSGESGQRNREFLASSLFQQAQTLLGASQQTESQVIGKEQFGASQALAQQQLAAQIQQFNQQLQTSRQQFQSQQSLQQQQIQQNMDLFNKYIQTKGSGGMGIGEILGLTFQGLGAVGGVAGGIGALTAGIGAYQKSQKK